MIVKQTRTYFYELDFKLFDVTCLNKVLYCIVRSFLRSLVSSRRRKRVGWQWGRNTPSHFIRQANGAVLPEY